MKYSKATNYALHTMIHLLRVPADEMTGVQKLAELQKLSPTYLSKILTKLTKSGLVHSTPGANGGYQVTQPKDAISFLDVILAIEGEHHLFTCSFHHNEGCQIEKVMLNAEKNMKNELANKRLIEIATQISDKCSNYHR